MGTDHNVSLSGGTDMLTYRASVGLTDMNGILKRDNMNRATTGVALVGNFFDNHLKISMDEIIISLNGKVDFMDSIVNSSFDEESDVKNIDPLNFIKNIVCATLKAVILLVCFYLVARGQRMVGYPGLGMMLTGLIGILIFLYSYNKKYN